MQTWDSPAKYPPVYSSDGKLLQDSPVYTEKYFCFNAFLPTPEEILKIGYSRLFDSEMDGYRWNLDNWGTKWDIYHDKITLAETGWEEGCDNLFLSFDTAWSPPLAWFQKIVQHFKTLTFLLHYEEPGVFFAGDAAGEDGVYCLTEYTEEQCEELFRSEDDED